MGGGQCIAALWQEVQAYVFPVFCFSCKKEGSHLCYSCVDQIPWDPYIETEHLHPALGQLFSFGVFEKETLLSSLIEQIKFQYIESLISHFDSHISIQKDFFCTFDILAPLPLHAQRYAERGFNQSRLFAERIATQHPHIMHVPHLLKRKKKTLQQATLSRDERMRNVEGAFVLREKMNLKGKCVLLLDDVYTTGATLGSAAELLKKEGAKEVSACTMARGSLIY